MFSGSPFFLWFLWFMLDFLGIENLSLLQGLKIANAVGGLVFLFIFFFFLWCLKLVKHAFIFLVLMVRFLLRAVARSFELLFCLMMSLEIFKIGLRFYTIITIISRILCRNFSILGLNSISSIVAASQRIWHRIFLMELQVHI